MCSEQLTHGDGMNDLKEEIEALRGLRTSVLVERYTEVWGKPPRIKHAEYLRKRIAWKLHEQRCGGLSAVAKRRLEELIAEIDIGLGNERTVSGVLKTPEVKRRADGLVPGSVLCRRWHDQDIEVRVRDDGQFEWGGATYRTLTATVTAITGGHWNPRVFFGLTARKAAK
jgi:hypothetical protein